MGENILICIFDKGLVSRRKNKQTITTQLQEEKQSIEKLINYLSIDGTK